MTQYAVITLSDAGAGLAAKILGGLQADMYLHEQVSENYVCAAAENITRFSQVIKLTAEIFNRYKGIIYIMPCGVVARAIAPLLQSKLTDPAIVVMDILGRYAISFLSGHEGGANDLALAVGNLCGAEPVITTTSEAEKNIICGIGCRRGTEKNTIIEALQTALSQSQAKLCDVRMLSTIKLKENEPGLLAAATELGLPLRIITNAEILNCCREFTTSELVQEKTGLPAVAEPCALLAGRRTKLILKRITHQGVTIALARECCE